MKNLLDWILPSILIIGLVVLIGHCNTKNDRLNSSNNESADIKFEPNIELTTKFLIEYNPIAFKELKDSIKLIEEEAREFVDSIMKTMPMFNDTLHIFSVENGNTYSESFGIPIDDIYTISSKNIDEFKKCFPNSVKVRVFETERTIVVKDTLYYFGQEIINENDTLNEIFFKGFK